jgi:hypothetical protein
MTKSQEDVIREWLRRGQAAQAAVNDIIKKGGTAAPEKPVRPVRRTPKRKPLP